MISIQYGKISWIMSGKLPSFLGTELLQRYPQIGDEFPPNPSLFPSPPPPLFFTHGSVLSLVYFMLFVQSLHSIARAKLKYLSSIKFYLACFRLSGSKTKHNSMNATWPKSPPFLVFALLLISCHILFCVSLQLFYLQVIFYLTKHFAKENLKKLGLLTKIWIACFNLHFW